MTVTALTTAQTPATASTTEINESPFPLKNVITALFISTITALSSLLWSIPFGLIAGASSCILAWIANASAEQPSATAPIASPPATVPIASPPATAPIVPPPANLVEELHLNPAEELMPHYAQVPQLQGDELTRHTDNIHSLMFFQQTVHRAIYRHSLHYSPSESLFSFMRDHFHGMDFSRLTLRAVKPIRFESGQEGYEMILMSEPRGWVHLCINKDQDPQPHRGGDCTFTHIPQVTPFLGEPDLVGNHFSTFALPFRGGHESLVLIFVQDFRNMDLCQIELQSCRPVSFDIDRALSPGMEDINNRYANGFELVFSTPEGTVQYYSDQTGRNIANRTRARNVEYLPDN